MPTQTGSLEELATYLRQLNWSWGSQTISIDITDLTPEEQALARYAFGLWADVANVSYNFVVGVQAIFADIEVHSDLGRILINGLLV
jgi:hypothetical protein